MPVPPAQQQAPYTGARPGGFKGIPLAGPSRSQQHHSGTSTLTQRTGPANGSVKRVFTDSSNAAAAGGDAKRRKGPAGAAVATSPDVARMMSQFKAYEEQEEFLTNELKATQADNKDLRSRLTAIEKAHTKVLQDQELLKAKIIDQDNQMTRLKSAMDEQQRKHQAMERVWKQKVTDASKASKTDEAKAKARIAELEAQVAMLQQQNNGFMRMQQQWAQWQQQEQQKQQREQEQREQQQRQREAEQKRQNEQQRRKEQQQQQQQQAPPNWQQQYQHYQQQYQQNYQYYHQHAHQQYFNGQQQQQQEQHSHHQQKQQSPPQPEQQQQQQQQSPEELLQSCIADPPALDSSSSVKEIKAFLREAGVGPDMHGCTEKVELLRLAQERGTGWEVRRVIRCFQLLHPDLAKLAVFRYSSLEQAAASRAGLKKLFNSLSLRLHPDKNPGDALAKEAFQHLSAAHDALKVALQL